MLFHWKKSHTCGSVCHCKGLFIDSELFVTDKSAGYEGYVGYVARSLFSISTKKWWYELDYPVNERGECRFRWIAMLRLKMLYKKHRNKIY